MAIRSRNSNQVGNGILLPLAASIVLCVAGCTREIEKASSPYSVITKVATPSRPKVQPVKITSPAEREPARPVVPQPAPPSIQEPPTSTPRYDPARLTSTPEIVYDGVQTCRSDRGVLRGRGLFRRSGGGLFRGGRRGG